MPVGGSLSVFEPTIFTPQPLPRTHFIRPIHPSSGIQPDRLAISKILDSGWAGQLKIHGHRVQLHIPSDETSKISAFNRHGQAHKRNLSRGMAAELFRIFRPKRAWTIVDGEWLKSQDRIFVFDLLKEEGKSLRTLSYLDRWNRLPKEFLSPHIQTLPLLRSLDQCFKALSSPEPHIEGLVFRALHTPGFSDTSIIRCRKSS